MLLRQCPICGKIHKQGEQCPLAKSRQAEYDREHRNRESAAFYHSPAWKQMQQMVKAACHGLDMYEMECEHHIVKGRLVHHIIPLSEAPELALSLTNLIYVSDKTHKKIHDEYRKDADSKIRMQKKLFSVTRKIFGGPGVAEKSFSPKR